ncbi:MAG TPA: hypothetical protein VIK18_02775 [Pirellulales bacterium]
MSAGRRRALRSGWLATGWLLATCTAAGAQDRESAAPPAVDLQRLAAWLRQPPADPALLAAAATGHLPAGGLLRAALTAEDMDAECAEVHVGCVDAWANELERLPGDPPARAAAALKLLHQRVLKHYDAGASSLAGALSEGRYNCLGSVILFVALAERLGMPCRAVERPGHVLVRLNLERGWIDIETTSARGVGLPQTPGAAPAAERELSNRALLALLYFNRGCDLLERRAFRAALAANLAALELDPANARARNNLLAAWNNWALALARQGELRAAGALLSRGLELAPGYPLFAENMQAIAAIPEQ